MTKTSGKRKRQSTAWEKIFANHILRKGLRRKENIVNPKSSDRIAVRVTSK